jgi:uncharacterized protein YegP (UPF0339 family)
MLVTKKPGVTTKRAKDGRVRMKRGVHINRNNKGEFYATVVGKTGHVLVKTSESYARKVDALKALSSAYARILQGVILKSDSEYHDHTVVKKAAPKKK